MITWQDVIHLERDQRELPSDAESTNEDLDALMAYVREVQVQRMLTAALERSPSLDELERALLAWEGD